MLIRPATSLMGVNSGKPAVVVAERFVGHRGRPGAEHGFGQRPVGGEVEIGEDDLAGPQLRQLGRLRLLDLHDHLRPGVNLVRAGNDLGPGLLVILVGQPGAEPRAGLDQHLVARPGQFLRSHGQHSHAVFVSLDLSGHCDDHGVPFHDGIVSPAIISSNVWRRRMSSARPSRTSTSAASGLEL